MPFNTFIKPLIFAASTFTIHTSKFTLIITQTKLRQGEEIKPFKLSVISDESEFRFDFAGEVDEVQNKKADIKEAVKDILNQKDKSLFGKELFEELRNVGVEGGYSTFKSAIKEMMEKGEIFDRKGEKNKTFYSLVPFGQNEVLENVALPVG